MNQVIQVNWPDIKRRLYQDGCVDLLRGMACLRWSLLAGMSYEQAVRPWKRNAPELFKPELFKSARPAHGAPDDAAPPPRNGELACLTTSKN